MINLISLSIKLLLYRIYDCIFGWYVDAKINQKKTELMNETLQFLSDRLKFTINIPQEEVNRILERAAYNTGVCICNLDITMRTLDSVVKKLSRYPRSKWNPEFLKSIKDTLTRTKNQMTRDMLTKHPVYKQICALLESLDQFSTYDTVNQDDILEDITSDLSWDFKWMKYQQWRKEHGLEPDEDDPRRKK